MADDLTAFPVWLHRPPYGGPAMVYWAGGEDGPIIARLWWELARGTRRPRP